MLKADEHAPPLDTLPDTRQRRLRAWLTNVKYYLGLIVLIALGALTSPHAADGSNIFLSAANFSDVFRQVANVGVMSVGMTLVIITAGIDLSVGSVMGFGSVLTAILLTTAGSNAASWTALGLDAVSIFVLVFGIGGLLMRRSRVKGAGAATAAGHGRQNALRAGIALVCALLACGYAWLQLPVKVSLLTVLWMAPLAGLAIGALNGWIITRGRMQPFIVTLAAMVGVMGVARLVAGQDTAVYSIYSGSNATTDIEFLRALLFGVVPVPAVFFIVIALIADFVLNRTQVSVRDRRQREMRAHLGPQGGPQQDRRVCDLRDAVGARRRAVRGAVPAGQGGCGCRLGTRCDRRRGDRWHEPDGRRRADRRNGGGRADFRVPRQHPAAQQHRQQYATRNEGADYRCCRVPAADAHEPADDARAVAGQEGCDDAAAACVTGAGAGRSGDAVTVVQAVRPAPRRLLRLAVCLRHRCVTCSVSA
jgi:ribose/xylose/arabinose/galactoside ABC-type transport system permease subunit